MTIEILVTPNLRTSHIKAANHLSELSYKTLFLNFSENLELLVRDLVENRLTYTNFIEIIRQRKLVPEPINGWKYTAEPILKSLTKAKLFNRKLKCHCYRDEEYDLLSTDVAYEIALLTLRVIMKRKIDAEDWKKILKKGVEHRCDALDREMDLIHNKASQECICISGLDGKELEQRLSAKGHNVILTDIEEFYHPTPIEILKERLAKKDISIEETEELVKEHMNYVRKYILKSRNRDQAYYQWAYDKFPSLRQEIDPEEIKHLDIMLPLDDV
jgi:hypothetical protein